MRYLTSLLAAGFSLAAFAFDIPCLDPLACNFMEEGNCFFTDENGDPCVIEGCTIEGACNYDPEADIYDGSCEFVSCLGCTDSEACNYDEIALYDDDSCIYYVDCNGTCGGDWIEDACGNCYSSGTEIASAPFDIVTFSPTNSISTWIVPENIYFIEVTAEGASGGGLNSPGGYGASITTILEVTPGESFQYLVGTEGSSGFYIETGGGGGGSFFAKNDLPLVVAGGGGGNGLDDYDTEQFVWKGANASLSECVDAHSEFVFDCVEFSLECDALENYTIFQFEGGCGGPGFGGAGFYVSSDYGAESFLNGGNGGAEAYGQMCVSPNPGGFGGGGQAGNGGGGGGGYMGGHGGTNGYCGGVLYYSGGGGGSSYSSNTPSLATLRSDHGDGSITIAMYEAFIPTCNPGCTYPQACNYNPESNFDDGSCDYCFCGEGTQWVDSMQACIVTEAALMQACGEGTYWDDLAQACLTIQTCQEDLDGNGVIGVNDLLELLSFFGSECDIEPEATEWACGDPVNYHGYDYATVLIGEQCWIAENLRTEHYANGDAIPGELTYAEWSSTTAGAQAVYGEGNSYCSNEPCDEVANLTTYSRLYNWYAVDDARGLCPSGWHVPTDGEFMSLEMELGMSSSEANSTGWRGTNQGAQMKASASDSPSWNGTNSSGFSALPGGIRYDSGGFGYEGSITMYWSSSPSGSTAWRREVHSGDDYVGRLDNNQRYGFSVRCVQD